MEHVVKQETISSPDLRDFERANYELGSLNASQYLHLAGVATTGGRKMRPDQVPVLILDAIGWDEVVRWSEWLLLQTVRNPELYYMRGEPKAVAEHEAWLRRLLPALLPPITRAFCYGAIPIVLDWGVRRLETTVPSGSSGGKTRAKNYTSHVHYRAVHELYPGGVQIETEGDRLIKVHSPGGDAYGGQDSHRLGEVRAFLPVWDKQFGRWCGQGSRRAVYPAWFDKGYHELWANRYLERSVDPVRLGRAPSGDFTLPDGTKISAVNLLRAILSSTRNGSSMVIPSETVEGDSKERAWDVGNLEQPDRMSIWETAHSRNDLKIMRATLSPAGMKGELDESLYFDFVQGIGDWVACELTRIVSVVHRMNHGVDSEGPVVLANDVPKAKKRVLLELVKATAQVDRFTKDGRRWNLAQLIPASILDQLGVKSLSVDEAAHKEGGSDGGGQPGRKRDTASDREERRDDARTEEGQNDTGGEDMDREEQQG